MIQDFDIHMLLFRTYLLLVEGQRDTALLTLESIYVDEEQQQERDYLLGWAYVLHRRWDDATRVLTPLSRHIEIEEGQINRSDRERRAICLLHLGYAAVNVFHFEDASRHFSKSLKLLQDKRVHLSEMEQIRARYSLAMTYSKRGFYSTAIHHYEEALLLFLYIKNDEELAHIYHGLCDTLRRWEKLVDAKLAGENALLLYEKLADRHREGQMHNLLGHICQGLGDYTEASSHYTEAMTIANSSGCLRMVMANYTALADLCLTEGCLEEAKRYCQQALEITDRMHRVEDGYFCGLTYLVTGKVTQVEAQQAAFAEQKQNLLEEAIQYFDKAKSCLSTMDAYDKVAETYERWAESLEELGHFQEALQCWRAGYIALSSAKGQKWG